MRNNNLNYICGSRLDTDTNQLSANVSKLASYVDAVLHDKYASLSKKHNTFTSYCLKMFAYSTGHRPVTDMFAFREDIDLIENIVVINDKISTAATENRVCWFSQIANKQIKAYLKHLVSLAKLLHKERGRTETSHIIYGLTEPKPGYRQSIPLFFFLDNNFNYISITPSLLQGEINDTWPYIQDNHNRHCLESQLDRMGISSTLIDLQTGHQRNQNHLLGISTSWTAAECASILKPALDAVTENQGWRVLEGLTYDSDIQLEKSHPKPAKEFGHLLRKTARQENLIKLENKIKDIVLGEVKKYGGFEAYLNNVKSQEKSIESILSECLESENLSQNTIEIFINILKKMAKDHGISPLKSLNVLPIEPSPFKDGWLNQYVTARDLRQKFVQYLKSEIHVSKNGVEYSWATVIVSAVLFSGVFKYEWISYLIETSPKSLRKIKKWLYYIDIWTEVPSKELNIEYQSPNWRWYPDPLSRHLILRCLQKYNKTTKRALSVEKVNQSICNILLHIDFQHSKNSNPINKLCNVIEAYWIYHFPSYIRSIFQSKIQTRPLPERTLARLCYKKRLSIKLPEKDNRIYISEHNNPINLDRNLKEYLAVIKSSIKEASKTNKNNKPQQLSVLKARILLAHKKYSFPEIAITLSQWLLHMIEYGGAKKKILAIGTIDDYFFSIAKPLLVYIGNSKLEEYDEEIISDIYTKVINFNDTQQSNRADQLHRFNLICSEYGLIDFNELDWGSIAGKWLSKQETRVDANIVTPEEYYQSLDLINNSKLDDYTKSWAIIFLILGYRFGLRIGEAHHIRWQDIQRLDNQIIIQVQRTKWGNKKTPAAIRQIPLMGKLSTLERVTLENHLEMIKNTKDFSIKSHIFHTPGNTNELLPRHIIWSVIHSVLRSITGDQRIRFHHLRHSFATGHFLSNLTSDTYIVGSESDNPLWTSYAQGINRNLINPLNSQAYMLSSLACAIGHTKFTTTLHSYIHLADDIAAGYALRTPFPEISIFDLSKITGYKESTLKSRIRTKKLNKQNYNAMDVLATIQIGEEIPAYDFVLEKYPKTLNYDIKKPIISITDIYEVLTSAAVEHCQPDVIAYLHRIEEQDVLDILNAGKEIERETSFTDFGLTIEDNNWFPTYTRKGRKAIYNEKTTVTQLLSHLNKIISSPSVLHTLIDGVFIWSESTRLQSSGNELIFKSPNKLHQFLSSCKLLGYESTVFNIIYSMNLSKENEMHLLNNLNRTGITNAKPEKIRRLDDGVNEQRLNFVKSTINKSTPSHLPKKLASLNQIYFTLSIYFKINKK